MKTFKQTRDVLHLIQEVHHELSELYEELSHQADRIRVRMLLDHMSRHQAGLERCLKVYERLVPAAVLDMWFQYVPDEATVTAVADVHFEPAMSADEITEEALRLDETLVELYRELAANAGSAQVRDVFENLLELERHEELELMRDAAGM